jgi:NAD(P)-dependent dehydrogenase (short-subunit alcohol dehydrogenase family)
VPLRSTTKGVVLAERAALVTGGSSGIGLAIARALGEDGYGVTVAARRPDKLEAAVDGLRSEGLEVQAHPANLADEEEIVKLFAAHRERFGRLDVLANNAGVGIGGELKDAVTKHVDMQIGVNLRSYVIATREALPMLTEAGREHGKALIVNTSSIAGKQGQGWLSVYSATKAGVIGLTEATQKEVGGDGIQVTALCPGFVDTPMTDWARDQVSSEEMIRPEDIAESVRFLLRTSPACVVPEIVFQRPAEVVSVSA